MQINQLLDVKNWFKNHVDTFVSDGATLHPMMQLKVRHSERVAKEARSLAAELSWSISRQYIAEAIGLLHDIGRFSQFAQYGTFADSISVDHGEYGWIVAKKAVSLLSLPSKERQQILDSIRHHNAKAIPDDISVESLPFLKLIRDADKLDILTIVINALKKDGFSSLPEMLPSIVLDRSCSRQLILEMQNQRCCSMSNVKTLGDFLIMKLSWAYDFNYLQALRRFAERRMVSRIVCELPEDPIINSIALNVEKFIATRLNNHDITSATRIY